MDILSVSVIVVGAVMAIATIGPSIAQGIAVFGAMQGISRQPEAAGPIATNLIIGLAFIESVAIYALVVVLLLLFADPFTSGAKDQTEMQARVNVLKLKVEEMNLQKQLAGMQSEAGAAAAKAE